MQISGLNKMDSRVRENDRVFRNAPEVKSKHPRAFQAKKSLNTAPVLDIHR